MFTWEKKHLVIGFYGRHQNVGLAKPIRVAKVYLQCWSHDQYLAI